MMAVTSNGQRPEMPADPLLLLGGSFPGLPEYHALMEACWDADPGARPSAEQASSGLHALLVLVVLQVDALQIWAAVRSSAA